jgi:predicted acyl esterase
MIVIDKNVMVPMTDGVRLATDVFRLQEAPPSPVLLVRTPYGKDQMIIGGSDSFDILRAVQAGYVVVAQDVRGRYGSNGEFEPNVNETSDGVDMITWAAAQPWSSGVVGTFGGSYLGGTQWLPALAHPTPGDYWLAISPNRATSGSPLRASISAAGTTSSSGAPCRTSRTCADAAAASWPAHISA